MKRPYLMFDGKKFAYSPKTGYYFSTTKPRKGMHVYVPEEQSQEAKGVYYDRRHVEQK